MNIKLFAPFILLSCASVAQADTQSFCQKPSITIAGPREVIFNYKTDRCSDIDTPDTPTMAFKDASGQVRLFNGIAGSYMSVGATLNAVKRDCSQPLSRDIKPPENNTPQSYDNWKWFRSPWTNDGKTVYGLIHNEFHGWEKPREYCPSGKQDPCLYPNVTVSKSTDSGRTFKVVRNAKGEVVPGLVTPYAYDKNAHKQAGIRAPTNIISRKENGQTYYYLLASNRGAKGVAQKAGTCLYRSDDVSQPERWRAWDGKGFTVAMNTSVYRNKALDVKQHLCKPVFNASPSSWTYNTALNLFVAVVGMNDSEFSFGYVTSPDLVNWSSPERIMKTTFNAFQHSRRGSGVSGQTYPSIIDPDSPGMNFEFSGAHPYLYFTRFNPKVRGGDWHNRDLMRVKLAVRCQ